MMNNKIMRSNPDPSFAIAHDQLALELVTEYSKGLYSP